MSPRNLTGPSHFPERRARSAPRAHASPYRRPQRRGKAHPDLTVTTPQGRRPSGPTRRVVCIGLAVPHQSDAGVASEYDTGRPARGGEGPSACGPTRRCQADRNDQPSGGPEMLSLSSPPRPRFATAGRRCGALLGIAVLTTGLFTGATSGATTQLTRPPAALTASQPDAQLVLRVVGGMAPSMRPPRPHRSLPSTTISSRRSSGALNGPLERATGWYRPMAASMQMEARRFSDQLFL